MTIAETITSLEGHLRDAYSALQDGGFTMPTNKNMANLASTINSKGYSYDLAGLQKALDDGVAETVFPIGTMIPDYWDETEWAPLVVVSYGSHERPSSSQILQGGVALQRLYAGHGQAWGNTGSSVTYATSSVFTYLNGEYYTKSSAQVKKYACWCGAADYSTSSSNPPVNWRSYWYLPSIGQLCGVVDESSLNLLTLKHLDYYSTRCNISSSAGSTGSYPGRISFTLDPGTPTEVWTRQVTPTDYANESWVAGNSSTAYYVASKGQFSNTTRSVSFNIQPIIEMCKGGPYKS